MHSSPTSTRKQANFATSASAQPRKSISFINPSKASGGKGYAGANQSKMAVSRMGFIAETKPAEKLNIPSTKSVQVLDAKGVDVTPRPLYHPDPHAASAKPNKLLTSQEGSLGSDYISSYSLYQNTLNPSMLGQYTRSVMGSSTVSKSSISTTESITEDLEDPSYKRDRLASFTDVRVMRAAAETAITKEELEKNIEIILTETETLRFFDLPTVMFSIESDDAEKIIEKNKNYEILCRNRLGNDLYVERMMQTFNGAPKNKEVQCEKIIMEEKGVVATTWDLYDSFNIPENLLAAKRSAYSSKGSLPARDRDPKIQGKYCGQTPDCIPSRFAGRPRNTSSSVPQNRKSALLRDSTFTFAVSWILSGKLSFVFVCFRFSWMPVCSLLLFETGSGTNWPGIHTGPPTQTEGWD